MKTATQNPSTTTGNLFIHYFNQVLQDKKPKLIETGPYISISRDFGSMANDIAQRLAEALTHCSKSKGLKKEWKWLNQSVLIESSKALELSPAKIEYVFRSKRKTAMDEVVEAMSTRYYKSDKRIRNTIIKVISSIAQTGHVIIVGRGGVAFRKDNPHSLHIKLTAPLDWRIERISHNYSKGLAEAKSLIMEIDKERKYLIDNFMGFETDSSIFDAVFNRKTMTEEEIVSIILNLAESRKMIC
jgi:cytidylate kinase